MTIRRLRHLLCLVLALFTLNSIAGVAGACAAGASGHSHSSPAGIAGGDQPPCAAADGAASCVEHYAEDGDSADQKAPADLPTAAGAAPCRVVPVLVPSASTALHLADSRPLFGPSLTILFGHLLV